MTAIVAARPGACDNAGMRAAIRLSVSAVVVGLAACAPTPPARPYPVPAALETYQRDVIAPLTGAAPIRAGVTLTNRFTPENKRETRAFLSARLAALGLTPERHTYSPEAENVFAVLRSGRRDAEMVVLGAHLDSVRVAPGASDNATGVATVLAVARDAVALRNRTRDLMIVFFDEEERGLVGARRFAERLAAQPAKVHSVHTVDQVGWDTNGNGAIELELPYLSPAPGAVALYTDAARALGLTAPIWQTPETGSDHHAFRRAGFPAVGVTEEYRHNDTSPFIHRAGDTFETVDFTYLGTVTRIVAMAMRRLLTTP